MAMHLANHTTLFWGGLRCGHQGRLRRAACTLLAVVNYSSNSKRTPQSNRFKKAGQQRKNRVLEPSEDHDSDEGALGVLDAAQQGGNFPTVVVKRGRSVFIRRGHPMLFGNAVEAVKGNPAPGDLVVVANGINHVVAWGVYNPTSMYRVRIMELEDDVPHSLHGNLRNVLCLKRLLSQRIQQAVELRRALGLPSCSTNVYRLINSEGDGLSGLVVDVCGRTLVVSSSAFWLERFRDSVISLLLESTGARGLVWRQSSAMLKAEGWTDGQQPEPLPGDSDVGDPGLKSSDGRTDRLLHNAYKEGQEAKLPCSSGLQSVPGKGATDGRTDGVVGGLGPTVAERSFGGNLVQQVEEGVWVVGDVEEEVVECGVRYNVELVKGQKTGFYADQRDNRAFLATLCAGARVLDMCCYSGGFGLNAAAQGAAHVTFVDSSASAIELARQNAVMNGVEGRCTFVVSDIAGFMTKTIKLGLEMDVPGAVNCTTADQAAACMDDSALPVMSPQQQPHAGVYDVVVLDPPKLAPNRAALPAALRKYQRLNAAAMQLVRPGGCLMTCSCSGAVAQSEGVFQAMLQEAAADAGRQLLLLRAAGAAADHPVKLAFPEGKYLTTVLLQVL